MPSVRSNRVDRGIRGMKEKRSRREKGAGEEDQPPVLMIVRSLDSDWVRRLRDASVNFSAVTTPAELRNQLRSGLAALTLVDMSADPEMLRSARDQIGFRRLEHFSYIVSLVEGSFETFTPELVKEAFDFGAQDFIFSGMRTEIITERLRFAYRHALAFRRALASKRSPLDALKTGNATWIWEPETDTVYLSEPMRYLFRTASDRPLSNLETFLGQMEPEQRKLFSEAMEKVKETGKGVRLTQALSHGGVKGSVEHKLVREKDPATGRIRIRGLARLRGGRTGGARDIFNTDQITGLANQKAFLEELAQALEALDATAEEGSLGDEGFFAGLLVFDVDRFKRLIAVYGRSESEDVLRQIVARMEKVVAAVAPTANGPKKGPKKRPKAGGGRGRRETESCSLASLSRDEFAVLIPTAPLIENIIEMAEGVMGIFKQPFSIKGDDIYLSAGMGVSVAPVDGVDAEMLLRRARIALGHAKDQPSGGYQFFSPLLATSQRQQVDIENKLRGVISGQELDVLYQPIVDIASGHIHGVEALVRWKNPEFESLATDAFVAAAEEVGMLPHIAEWVLSQAIRDVQSWQEAGLDALNLSINISPSLIGEAGLVRWIIDTLEESGFSPDHLTLEVTESVIMRDVEKAVAVIELLKTKGIRLALDDFGTGYSSLAYLKNLPMDLLKIDRSFIRDMADDPASVEMVRAIVGLAQTLDMQVTAEGVETVEQLNILREIKCDRYQGFLCSAPISAGELAAMLGAASGAGKNGSDPLH